jgi:hypothetical protein
MCRTGCRGANPHGRVTLALAGFFAGLGACLVVDLLTERSEPGRFVTGLLAVASLLVAFLSLVTRAFG